MENSPKNPPPDPDDSPPSKAFNPLESTVLDEAPDTVLQDSEERQRLLLKIRAGGLPKEIPVRLGRYLIDGVIGRGSMGVVYRARQDGLNRVVALKLLIHGEDSARSQRRRFEREARSVAKLRHPNIVSVHEVGDYEGQPFFTMDFIDGTPLHKFVEQKNITSSIILSELCMKIAEAIHYAHEKGVIHRDLKPANILVDNKGEPIITDFGLAKDLDSGSMVSITGDIMGTPAFMSPEQAKGKVKETGPRSDVYSLGAILYSLLTKNEPFSGKTLMETLSKVINVDPPEVTTVNPEIEGELGAICMKAMEKEKQLRYDSAMEFADDLRRFINGYPVLARPLTWQRKLHRFVLRRRRELVATAAALVLVVLAAVFSPVFFSKGFLDITRTQLASGDPSVRIQAIQTLSMELSQGEQLAEDELPGAMTMLLSTHTDTDPNVQLALMNTIAKYGRNPVLDKAVDYEIRRWVISRADDPANPAIRNAAINVLGIIRHPEIVDYLIGRLKEPNPVLRSQLVASLGEQRSARATRHLMKLVLTDHACRPVANHALNKFFNEGTVSPIGVHNRQIQSSIKKMFSALNDRNREIEKALSEISGKPVKQEGPLAAYETALSSGSEESQIQAVYELSQSGDPKVLPLLTSALDHPNPLVGSAAAYAISRLKTQAQLEIYRDLLISENPRLRGNAALVLGFSHETESVHNILVALQNESALPVMEKMVQALGELRDPAAASAIREAASRNSNLETAAQNALSRLKPANQ